jgi:hypothetical protein
MIRRRSVLAASCLCVFVLALAGGAGAVPPDPVNGGDGKQWRQLYETTGLTWNQVAQLCPRDGATACAGSLSGWTWATDAQVVELLGHYAPAILTASPTSVSGPEYYLPAGVFIGDMRWTTYFATTYQFGEWTGGWTASMDETGTPIGASVGDGFPPPSGAFEVGPVGTADTSDPIRGVWLWRPSDADHTPPVIASTIDGTSGANGWYVSDV